MSLIHFPKPADGWSVQPAPEGWHVRRVRAGQPAPDPAQAEWDVAVRNLMQTASEAAYADGMRTGYCRGVRAGRLAAFVWGAMLVGIAITAWAALT